jgi:predicted ATPase
MMETLEVELFVRKRLRKEIAFPDIEVSYDELVFADSGGVFHPIHSFGLGVGTILPVLVGLAASDAELLIIEEPECHVHPRVQSCIGDLIIERALESHDSEPHPDDLDCGSSIGWEETSPNRHVIVETHSEHLILRILRRIREKTLGKLPDGINPITKDDVAVLFVSPSFEGAIVRELRITDKGKFLDSWPGGFFEESFDEMF